MYALFIGLFAAALFGTSRATPIAGAGYEARAWQEGLVYILLGSGSVAILIATALMLHGLSRRRHVSGPPPADAGWPPVRP
jgi:(hydroxyamino)benzene mutase